MINVSELRRHVQSTPAFLLDENRVIANLRALQTLRQATGCKILYSMKALPLVSLLELLKEQVDGFSVSSLFEARLAKEVFGGNRGSIHLTTPGIRDGEFGELGQICSHISFNSLSQYLRLVGLSQGYSKGLRVNPKVSFVDDDRCNPCRAHSKLGIDVGLLRGGLPEDIEGLHIHTVFARRDFVPMLKIVPELRPIFERHRHLTWLNLGGGYLYHSVADQSAVIALINELRSAFGIDVYLEPGKAVVGNAGYLLTTVLDRFESDGKTVLILDTSVNHHPEVFEYQTSPSLLQEGGEGDQVAILAGSTCLAGDLFGEYRFRRLPDIGERLLFGDVGAYSLIKASRFNGYNLPDIYRIHDGRTSLFKRYEYEDFRRQWHAGASIT